MTTREFENWLFELFFKPLRVVAPYIRTNYWLDGPALMVKSPFRKPVSLPLNDIDEIGIETTDQGPFAEDVFWLLKRGKLRIRIAQLHPVFKVLMERFGELDGFDWRPFSEAMACTDNRYFLCWRREALQARAA